MRQHALMLSALVLAASSSLTLAQGTIIRCGGGTTSTAGVEINSAGELIFPETSIVCGTTTSQLPPALDLSITSPSQGQEINVASAPQNLPFSASLTNFTAPHDQCPNVTLVPPSGTASNIPLVIQGSGSNYTGSATFSFTAESPMGTYQASLNCTRNIEGQQILLNLPSVNFNVTGGGASCPSMPTVMQINIKNYSDPFPNGLGVAFGQAVTGDKVFSAGNLGATTSPPSPPQVMHVRAWRFTAPSTPLTGEIKITASSSTVGVTGISECPGNYNLPLSCRKNSNNSQIKWSTKSSEPGACLLEPGRIYYLYATHLNLSDFTTSGAYNSSCGCAAPPCGNCPIAYQPWAATP